MANPTRARAHADRWLALHPDYLAEWRGRSSSLELARGYRHARRAHIANVLATLTVAEWEAILEAADHACIYCGSHQQPTMDHLMPLARGGQHTAENVAPACLSCNDSKGAKTVAEFLAVA